MTPFIATPAAATIIMRRGCNGDRRTEAMNGFDGDPEGDDDQRGGVDEGGEYAGALIAEGTSLVGGARLEVDGGEAEQEGQKIGGVVAGLRQQGQGVGAQAGDEGNDDVGQRGDQRDTQHERGPFCGLARRGRVDMHRSSVTGVG